MFGNGDNTFTVEELEELFNEDVSQETPPATEDSAPQSEVQTEPTEESKDNDVNNVEQTKAFAKRLRESTEKARNEEREAIAKSFGYESYGAMIRERQSQLIKDKGYDPEDISPMVDEIVKQRIDADPRMKELEDLKRQKVADYAKRELADISKLTNGQITRLEQLPSNVIELWKQKGSLKSAYLELEGENLISKLRNEQIKGSTTHMNTPGANSTPPSTKRPLTDEEKQMWRVFNPGISEEELNKKLTDK